MTIWVDADSCPRRIREIISKAAGNYRHRAVFVSNRPIPFPQNAFTRSVTIAQGIEQESDKRKTGSRADHPSGAEAGTPPGAGTSPDAGSEGATHADADSYIVSHARAGDLAITRDIPLAASLVEQDVLVLNDRGTRFTRENVRERLSIRDFMYDLRQSTGYDEKRRNFGKREIHAFAAALDEALRKG
jgi:hypothetical protein